MIVPKMTPKEICDVFYKDLPLFENQIEKLPLKKYERILKTDKTGDWLYFNPVHFTSKDKTDYFLIPNSPGWKDYKKKGLAVIFVLLYERSNGIHAVLHTPNSRQYNFTLFPPHFFQRYQERYLHRPDLSEKDTILEFFKHGNSTFKGDGMDNDFYSVAADGYLLGTILEKGVQLCKTFVGFEMLKGNQISDKKRLEQELEQYMNENYGRTA